ncbi:MAG: VWA domain-containing protein [Myxococcota bacterium]
MKPIFVILWSAIGMASTSGGVAWMTSDRSPSASGSSVFGSSVSILASSIDDRPKGSTRSGDPAPTGSPEAGAVPHLTARFETDGLLHVEGRLGHASLPAGSARESFVLVSVDASSDRALARRPGVDVSIVIDRSGSMKGSRLRNAVAAARGMVDRLGPDDRISLVAYDDNAELMLGPRSVRDLDRRTFDRLLASLRRGGNTCLSCGLLLGLAQLGKGAGGRSEGVRRVLLLSDGKANRGLTTPTALRGLGDRARRQDTAIASIGIDVDYDERTMFAVSEASNGRHYFAEHPGMLADVFEQERRALVGTVADRAHVDVTLAEGIELLEVVDRPHRRQGDTLSLPLGSFAAGEAKTVLLRVLVRGGERARTQPVASVQLAYRDLEAGRDHTHRGDLGLLWVAPDEPAPTLDPAVEARLGRKQAFDALVAANAAFEQGNVAAAEKTLEQARDQIRVRRRRSAAAPEPAPAVDADFESQLQALGSASSTLREASRGVAPTAAPKKRKGKASIRRNLQVADPFSD